MVQSSAIIMFVSMTLQGNVHAYPDTDQGFPITAAELRQRWMDLMEAAARNPMAQAIFDDPSNQEQAATALGVPGMTVPGAAMRSKVLQNIDKLIQSQPIPTTNRKPVSRRARCSPRSCLTRKSTTLPC